MDQATRRERADYYDDHWDGYDDDNDAAALALAVGVVVGAAVGSAAAASNQAQTTTTTTTAAATNASLPCNPSVSSVQGVTYYQCGQQYYVQAYSGTGPIYMPTQPPK